MNRVNQLISDWHQRPANVKCEEVCSGLRRLGFSIRNGKRGNHKIVSHSDLPAFMGTNFDCGHGDNPTVKPVYIRKLIRVIRENKEELNQLWRNG